jgi:hypothetical protein
VSPTAEPRRAALSAVDTIEPAKPRRRLAGGGSSTLRRDRRDRRSVRLIVPARRREKREERERCMMRMIDSHCGIIPEHT